MQFEKTFTEFPDCVHRLIYLTALRQTPLENSLSNTEGIGDDLLESCKQYHQFIMDLLSRMYQDPDSFGMNPGKYEAFMGGKKENAMKRKMPEKTNAIRSETYNCVASYFRLLNRFAQYSALEKQSLLLSMGSYQDILTHYDSEYNKKIKNTEKLIPYQIRLNGLKQAGLEIHIQEDGSVRVTNDLYPKMFQAMHQLSHSGWGKKPYGEHNFLYTDFRQIWNEKHIPCYEDFMRILPDAQKAVMDQIRSNALAAGLKEACKTFWKVDYLYKGKHVMCIDSETDWMGEKGPRCNNGRVKINGGNTEHYLDNIRNEGEAFIDYFMKHLSYCVACSTSHIGRLCDIFGRKVRICCEPHTRIMNPAVKDLSYISKLIEIRKQEALYEKANQ